MTEMETDGADLVDVDAAPAPSFGLAVELDGFSDSGSHHHDRHQILYACRGALHLEVAGAQWLLPSRRAAIIPADTVHRVVCRTSVSLRTVYLARDQLEGQECCVFTVSPLAREMMLHAMRWGPEWNPRDEPVAASFFTTLALLAREWITADPALRLPRPESEELRRAFDHALAHLADVSMEQAAKAAAVSPRTLARRFQRETSMSWRTFLRTARVLRAMDFLAQPGTQVTRCAFDVGFESLGAFSKAFRDLTGETPSGYQKRVLG